MVLWEKGLNTFMACFQDSEEKSKENQLESKLKEMQVSVCGKRVKGGKRGVGMGG